MNDIADKLTTVDAADYAGVTEAQIILWVLDGRIKFDVKDQQILVDHESLYVWCNTVEDKEGN